MYHFFAFVSLRLSYTGLFTLPYLWACFHCQSLPPWLPPYNLYTDLLVARRRRSSSEESKKRKEKRERTKEKTKESARKRGRARREEGGQGERGEKGRRKERVDTHTIYTRAAHKSGLRIVAASSAARATINSPLLLSAPLLGAPLCIRTRSLPFPPRRIVSPNGESFRGLSVLPTSPCFIERSLLSALFAFHDFVVGGPLPPEAASLISTLASCGLEKFDAFGCTALPNLKSRFLAVLRYYYYYY